MRGPSPSVSPPAVLPHVKSLRHIISISIALAVLVLPAAAAAQRDTSRAGATPLPGIVARGEREACPGRDDPAARALWEGMRARYDLSLDSASMWVEMTASSGYVAPGALMRFDTLASNRADRTTDGWNVREAIRDAGRRGLAFYDAPRVGPGRRGMSGRLRGSLARAIAREGYARRTDRISADITQASAAWTYPPLDAELASHFAADGFGERTFFRVDRAGAAAAIGFCTAPRFRAMPYISGTLFLRADGSLERVQWHYHTPEPHEDAGGQVRFAASEPGRALVAAEGEVYRRDLDDRFYHRRLTYAAWTVDAAPFLAESLLPAPLPPRPGDALRAPVRNGRQ